MGVISAIVLGKMESMSDLGEFEELANPPVTVSMFASTQNCPRIQLGVFA